MRWPIIILICTLSIATLVKHFLNGLGDKGFPCDHACESMKEAQTKGVFLCQIKIDPPSTEWKGTPIAFESGWIEKQVKTVPVYVWWTKPLPRDQYYLCLRLKTGAQLFGNAVFFQRENQGHSFTSHGTASLEEELTHDQILDETTTIYITSDWKSPRDNPIHISWKIK